MYPLDANTNDIIDNFNVLVYNISIIYLKGQKMDDADTRSNMKN